MKKKEISTLVTFEIDLDILYISTRGNVLRKKKKDQKVEERTHTHKSVL